MIFSRGSIQKILEGSKTQTRRLLKVNESLVTMRKNRRVLQVISAKGAIKWQVDGRYAVQDGRGKPQVWYCPEHNFVGTNELVLLHGLTVAGAHHTRKLFIEVVDLRSEALFCIDEKGANKEGFENEQEFLHAFYKLNWNKVPRREKECCGNDPACCEWNPLVWMISFRVAGTVGKTLKKDLKRVD